MFDLSRVFSSLSKLKLAGGAIGRVTTALVAVCVCIALVATVMHDASASKVAIGAIFALALVILWRAIGFADKHPEAALLEGAQFIKHAELIQASMSRPEILVNAKSEGHPPKLASSTSSALDKPERIEGTVDLHLPSPSIAIEGETRAARDTQGNEPASGRGE